MGWVSRLPIRSKAPATVAILVLVVGAAVSAASYFVLLRALHDHVAGRLMTLQAQYRQTYRTSMANSRARIEEAASRPELAAYLREPVPTREAAARSAMPPPGPAPEWVVRIELRDASGRVLLSVPGPAAKGEMAFKTLDAIDGPLLAALASPGASSVGYGKLHRDGDAVLFPIVARLGDPASGVLVVWRRVATSWQASQQVATVLGGDAATYMINADGTLWSQSGQPVPSSPHAPVFDRVIEYHREGRGQVLSVSGPMEGTPWAFTFEFPAAVVQAPARTFLRMIAWIAATFILLGIVVAWSMSRRLTAPLYELTKAAKAIASGHLSYRAPVTRDDELGQLMTSFNTMAAEVEASRIRLESLVDERTVKLRAAEESLMRREKLALMGQFASSIGHEIRNPLGVIGNAASCLDRVLTDKTPEVRKYLDVLNAQVKLSADIVNSLLDLSRDSPPRRQTVDIASLLIPPLRKCASSDVAIEVDIPSDLPAVDVDPMHLARVIDNLLTNAVQAIHGKGVVRVKARMMDRFVGVEVSDSGPGVAAEHQTRIFEPLFTTKARGIGLGLALSKSLVQANGGDLELVSRTGEGATFAFTLPVAVQPDEINDVVMRSS
jgi:signal transduction histidine kinase